MVSTICFTLSTLRVLLFFEDLNLHMSGLMSGCKHQALLVMLQLVLDGRRGGSHEGEGLGRQS